jgi:hypothetical protein
LGCENKRLTKDSKRTIWWEVNMETKCLDSLEWFIAKSKKDKWRLFYNENLDLKIFGIILPCDDKLAWNFVPVLHGGSNIYGVVVR